MTRKPFSVRIFLQDGHVDGVKIIAKSKWPGRALVIPRASLPEEKSRVELDAPGVFVLVGPGAADQLPTIYVGSGDPVCHALQQGDVEKPFWDWAVVFAAKGDSLSPTQIRYFAARLVKLGLETGRARLDNRAQPELPDLTGEALADTESFLQHILSICPLLGLYAFEEPVNV